MAEQIRTISIFAPFTGKVVDLQEVPDQIYSKRMVGDGVAIIPEDGTMFSPVNGYLTIVTDHTFGFTTDDGLDILVHVGINAKSLQELGVVHKQAGNRVQAGDMIAEFNIKAMAEQDINTITPVLICNDLGTKVMKPATGHVQAGAGKVITIEDIIQVEEKKAEKPKDAAKEKAKASESEIWEYLQDKSNWPTLAIAFVAMTTCMIIVFVAVALLVGR